MCEPVLGRVLRRGVQLDPGCALRAEHLVWADLARSEVVLQRRLTLGLHRAQFIFISCCAAILTRCLGFERRRSNLRVGYLGYPMNVGE